MGKTNTPYNKAIFVVQFRIGRAASKREVMREALAMLDAVTRGQGPDGAGFRSAKELEAVVLQADSASAMTAQCKASKPGHSKRSTGKRRRRRKAT